MTPDAQIRGFKAGRFSFNVKGGRCEECRGAGVQTIEMNFLPDVYVRCKACGGHRYNRETLEVKYKGKNIDDVLNMTVNMAVEFFENIPNIYQKLRAIQEVGLGYLTLGQPCTTLSGGESQRIKLSSELSKRDTGRTLYILDEPTTGLHFEDIRLLLEVLNKLVDRGNTRHRHRTQPRRHQGRRPYHRHRTRGRGRRRRDRRRRHAARGGAAASAATRVEFLKKLGL